MERRMTNIVLLDGGMGQELVRRSPDTLTQLWGGAVLRDHPDIVGGLHQDFLRAGATAITTNSYSLTRPRLARDGQEDQLESLQHSACEVACEAIDAMGADVALLGCLPPLNGSYHPASAPSVEDAAQQFAEIATMQAPFVDALVIETMSSINEAQGALAGAKVAGKPIWLGLSTDDADGTKMRSGETLAETLEAVAGAPNLAARKDLSPALYSDFVMNWVAKGATIVGGCCEVGPAHIAAVAKRLTSAGHTLVKEPL
jgi:homocysteine S-methyltransferase